MFPKRRGSKKIVVTLIFNVFNDDISYAQTQSHNQVVRDSDFTLFFVKDNFKKTFTYCG